jgi:uncharacterized phage protein (TIGR02218 family)
VRNIPVNLQTQLDQAGTTLTNLLKIQASDGRLIGLTVHDQEIDFNDGTLLTYYPAINSSAIKAGANLEVDNTDTMMLLDVTGTFTAKELEAGILDSGRFWVYRVNWADLTDGFALTHFGTTGKAKTRDNTSGVIELHGLSKSLKQNFVKPYSITCRAVFGSQDGTDLFACNFDASGLRVGGVVDTVDIDEPDRLFTGTYPTVNGPNGLLPFAPGLVGWLTGNNAGAVIEIEAETTGSVELKFPMAYDIVVGDTFTIRPDCGKKWQDDCIDKFDNALNFRGEPLIPLGEEAPAERPGANIPGYGSGILPGT